MTPTAAGIGWPILLSVAAPFVLALAFIGRYLIKKLDASEDEKKKLYDKIITDLLTAIQKSTTATDSNTQTLDKLLDFVEDMKDDARAERDLRLRMEERLKFENENRS